MDNAENLVLGLMCYFFKCSIDTISTTGDFLKYYRDEPKHSIIDSL